MRWWRGCCIQLVNNVAPALKLPDWAGTLVLVLLLVGFPVALLLAWMRELAPADGATARATTGKLDWALMGALVVVIALVSYQQLAPTTGARTARQASVAARRGQPGGISIAVLPFANMSGDAGQEFFSDGMTEEINGALAKVPDLRVVGRTSAFQFKGQNKDLRAIGQALGATHLIEGSVRKAGTACASPRSSSAPTTACSSGPRITTASSPTFSPLRRTSPRPSPPRCACRWACSKATRWCATAPRTSGVLSAISARQSAVARPRHRGCDRVLEPVVARDPTYAPAWALLAQAYVWRRYTKTPPLL